MSRDYDRRRGGSSNSSTKLRMDSNSTSSQSRSHGESLGKRKELDNVMRKARESQSNYWNKKLLEVEEKDPNRWRHSGYKEMYVGGLTSGDSRSHPRSPRHPRSRSPRSPRSPWTRSPHTPQPKTPRNRNSHSPRRKSSRTRNSHTPRPRSPVVRRSHSRPRSPKVRRSNTPRPRSPRTPRERFLNNQTKVTKSPSSGSTCSDRSCSVCSPRENKRLVDASHSRSKSTSPVRSHHHVRETVPSSSRIVSSRQSRPRSPLLLRPRTPPPMPQPPLRHPKEYNKLIKDLKARKKEKHRSKLPEDPHIPESVQMMHKHVKVEKSHTGHPDVPLIHPTAESSPSEDSDSSSAASHAPPPKMTLSERSSRENYGDVAVGYVCLKRTDTLCKVNARICPEHRIKSKNYSVTLIVDESEEIVKSVECQDCAASSGGCKHAIAFLMWVNRRTENPSPTEVQCYWKKEKLAEVGSTHKFIKAKDMCKNIIEKREKLPDDTTFLKAVITTAKAKQLDSQLSRHNFDLDQRKLYSVSIHQLLIEFSKEGRNSANEFIEFATSRMPKDIVKQVSEKTKMQSDDLLWFELRYGRVTASKIYEAAHCKTGEGSLVNQILGASKVLQTQYMQRGKVLEKEVIKEVEKSIKQTLSDCGLCLIPIMPIVGASPDAIGYDFVVEVKCPSSDKTIEQYLSNGKPSPKCKAQMHLQMLATKTKKALFCVADPDFENNKLVKKIWIDYDENYISALLKRVSVFWEMHIFPKLLDSINR